jgi:hypothetical protein
MCLVRPCFAGMVSSVETTFPTSQQPSPGLGDSCPYAVCSVVGLDHEKGGARLHWAKTIKGAGTSRETWRLAESSVNRHCQLM